jgi:hypothetical protein
MEAWQTIWDKRVCLRQFDNTIPVWDCGCDECKAAPLHVVTQKV